MDFAKSICEQLDVNTKFKDIFWNEKEFKLKKNKKIYIMIVYEIP